MTSFSARRCIFNINLGRVANKVEKPWVLTYNHLLHEYDDLLSQQLLIEQLDFNIDVIFNDHLVNVSPIFILSELWFWFSTPPEGKNIFSRPLSPPVKWLAVVLAWVFIAHWKTLSAVAAEKSIVGAREWTNSAKSGSEKNKKWAEISYKTHTDLRGPAELIIPRGWITTFTNRFMGILHFFFFN